ncbi:antibiotic biosynthesis monooxygenase family protein [Paraburkholderia tropica]|uniref:antibiotic biosynthesis monooxygenase family protein n=1 Tax=Paraburkholderia tropica TaxID=92647 RepID=UPI002AAF534E|nr:antibiotic biosynthesis monooxygenase family protein [Paraburkholderia tropica]
MIEMATFEVMAGEAERFEAVFGAVGRLLASSRGHAGHRLLRDMNDCGRFVLIVDWRDGGGGAASFRDSGRLAQVRALLEPFHRLSPSLTFFSDVDTAADTAGLSPWKSHCAD